MRLLVIAPHYKLFIKDLNDEVAKSKLVDHINVLVHHNYLSEFSRFVNLSISRYIRNFSRERLIDLRNTPKNVNVNIISLLYFRRDSKNPLLGSLLAKMYYKFIEKRGIKFDLIHAHFTWPCGYAATYLGKKFKKPVVITGHGFDIYDLPFRNKFWFSTIRGILNNSQIITIESNKLRHILINNLRIHPDKISLIPNGFNCRFFKPLNKEKVRELLNLPLDKKIVINVANLVPIKGHIYLIKAIKWLSNYRNDFLLIIVGDGPLYKSLKTLVNKYELEDKIRFVGQIPNRLVNLWLNAADIFVLSSINENQPIAILEALGVGLPVISTKVGGVPEIISSDRLGILIQPRNWRALGKAILKALDMPWKREYIINFSKQFCWDKISNEYVNLYSQINSLF